MSATNTYSGTTTISSGTLLITEKLGNGSYSNTISNSGILSYSSSTNQVFSGIISGTGSIVKSGSGALTLSAMNTYSGGSTVNAGTLFGGEGSESNTSFGSGAITVASGATLWIDRANDNVMTNNLNLNGGTLQGTNGFGEYWDGDIVLGANSIINNYYDFTIDGVISGSFGFTKTENGNLSLRGTNTFTGSTTISAGTVSVSSSANLGATPDSTDADNIIFNGGTLNTTADFTLGTNKGITLTGAGTINTNTSTTLTYGGVIAGSGAFTKSGEGTLILSGNNTYTDSTAISAGVLKASNAAALGATSTGTTVANGAALEITTSINAEAFNIKWKWN